MPNPFEGGDPHPDIQTQVSTVWRPANAPSPRQPPTITLPEVAETEISVPDLLPILGIDEQYFTLLDNRNYLLLLFGVQAILATVPEVINPNKVKLQDFDLQFIELKEQATPFPKADPHQVHCVFRHKVTGKSEVSYVKMWQTMRWSLASELSGLASSR